MTAVFTLLKWTITLFAALLSLFNLNAPKTTVELYYNPASGYKWEYEMDKDGILSYSESHYSPDSGSALTGKGGGTQHYTFKVKGPGTVNITFRYYKYENAKKVVSSQYIYTYVVADDGTITLKNIQ